MQEFEGEELIECMKELVKIDQEWVPYSTTSSLYIRPTFIGTDVNLGKMKLMKRNMNNKSWSYYFWFVRKVPSGHNRPVREPPK